MSPELGKAMTQQRWQQVKALFEAVVELPEPERRRYLDAAGIGVDLRAEVEDLVASDDGHRTVLEQPLAASLADILPPLIAAGQRLGPYRIEQEIGRGGMAVVYAARRDDEQYRQKVAIKVIKRGMDTDSILARFRQERQILAQLSHPYIARLLDGGTTPDGLPFLVMEHIEGEPIDCFCQALGLHERIEIFAKVCDAVQFAHRNLVVHRDLKPSNILVADAEPKLLDFGIAKLLDDGEHAMASPETAVGTRPMTPNYASPEQIRGELITTASDVYALGVLLFELLAGRSPRRIEDRPPAAVAAGLRQRIPERPSAAACQPWSRRLRGDLDTIVGKAMQPEPERRYGSAGELADDLRRHLAGFPVAARRDSLTYLLGKFVRRQRMAFGAACLVVLSLLVGVFLAAWQARRADRARDIAEAERAKAVEVSSFLVELFQISEPGRAPAGGSGDTVTARQLLDEGALRISRGLEDQPGVRAALMETIGVAFLELGLYARAEPLLLKAQDLHDDATTDGITSNLNVGRLRVAQGVYDEGEALLRRALSRARQLGPEHPLVSESLNRLGLVLLYQGRLDPSEQVLREALDLRLRGADPVDQAISMHNLALVLKEKSQFADAEALYRQALELNVQELGEQHPDVTVNRNNLAEILRAQGRCKLALPLYEDNLDLQRQLFGEHHPTFAITQNNLAGCLKDLGQLDQAEALYRSSLEIRRLAFEEAHPDVLGSLNNLAGIYFQRGELDRAEELYRQVVDLQRPSGEAAHLARNLNNLAVVLTRRGDWPAAEALYREALAMASDELGEEHAEVLGRRQNLAAVLLKAGRLQDAEAEFRRVAEARQRILGSGHPDTAKSHLGLARALLEQEHASEAEVVLRQALDAREVAAVPADAQSARLRASLGDVLHRQGRFAAAESELLESLRGLDEELGPEHPKSKQVRERLAALYQDWGKPPQPPS